MKRGFTLLELLVAMALLSIVLTTVYQSFRINIRSIEAVKGLHDEIHFARLVLSMMARDLESAYWEPKREEGSGSPEEEGAPEQPAIFLVKSIQQGGRTYYRLAFLSLGPSWGPNPSKSPVLHEVEYRLAEDPERDRIVLVRREDPTPDEQLLSGGEAWLLAPNVRSFQVQCTGADGESRDTWDSREAEEPLPRSVLLKVAIADPRDPEAEGPVYSVRVALARFGEEAP